MDYNNLFHLENNQLFWKNGFGGRYQGELAGSLRNDGYIGIFIDRKYYFAHRIIWEMHNGAIPVGMFIDHINGIRDDNDLNNLRLCSTQENARNRGKQSNNKSGFKGVSWHKQKGKWVAQIKLDGKNKFLGFFICPEEAYEAYCEKAIEHYGEFAKL